MIVFSPFQPIYDLSNFLSVRLGTTPLDSLYVVMFTVQVILSIIFRLIPRSWIRTKYLYNLICGILVVYIQHGRHLAHPLLISTYGYLFVALLDRVICPWVMLLTSFAHLILLTSIFPPQYGSSWNAAPGYMLLQMIITLKLSAVPFNLYDGYILSSKKQSIIEEFKKKMGKDYDTHEKFAVHEPPSFLSYFSFAMHFQTIGCGPVVEFSVYKSFVENDCDDENHPRIPFDVSGFLKRYFLANLFLILYSLVKELGVDCVHFKEVNIDGNNSLLSVIFFSYWAIVNTRFRLYCGLFFAESACLGSGLGYSGLKEGNHNWEHVNSSKVEAFEFGVSMRVLMNSWNIGVQKWLRYYVFNRVAGNKVFRMFCAMICSAIWHGVFSGYIIMWISLLLINLMYIELYKKIPILVNRKKMNWLMYIPAWFFLQIFVTHFTVGFIMFRNKDIIEYYSKFLFLGHALIVLILLVLKIIPRIGIGNGKKKKVNNFNVMEKDDIIGMEKE